MKRIRLIDESGPFAEDKDLAARLRDNEVDPSVSRGEELVIDFEGVTLTTQSFVHAMISQPLRAHGEASLALLRFQNCSPLVRGLIETVVQYSLESIEGDEQAL